MNDEPFREWFRGVMEVRKVIASDKSGRRSFINKQSFYVYRASALKGSPCCEIKRLDVPEAACLGWSVRFSLSTDITFSYLTKIEEFSEEELESLLPKESKEDVKEIGPVRSNSCS